MPSLLPTPSRYLLLLLGLLLLGPVTQPAQALDPNKDFHNFVSNSWSIEEGLPQISALAITQDADGYLWVGTQAGLARFDGHRFTAFTPEDSPGLPGIYVNALLADADQVWIGTYKGLARWRGNRFEAVPADSGPINVLALAQTSDGEVLAAAGSTVYVAEEGRLRPHRVLHRPARALLSEDTQLWIGSVGGVYRWQHAGEPEFLPFPANARNAGTRTLVRVRGQLWVGTSEGLLALQNDQWQAPIELPHLAHTPIEVMRVDSEGNLWIGELAHLSRLRADGSHERVVREGAGLSVRALFEDREANLWLGSLWSGVTRLRNGWTRRYSQRQGLRTPLLWSVAEGPEGSLWVGTDDGLARLSDGRFTQIVEGSALPHPSAYSLRAEGNRVWIGTRHGLALWEGNHLSVPARFEPLASLQINGIARDAQGRLWYATSDGLFLDHSETRSGGSPPEQPLQRFGQAEGLRDARVRFLLPTRDGRLLVSTQSGLFAFKQGGEESFEPDRGLPPEIDITVLHELPNGELVAGSLSETLYLYSGGRWHVIGTAQGMPRNAPFFLAHDETYLWIGGIRGIGRVPLADMHALAEGRSTRVQGEMLLNERGDRRGGQKGFCCNGAGNSKGLQRGTQLWAPSRDGLVVLDTHDVSPPGQAPSALVERLRVGGEWRALSTASGSDGVDLNLPVDARDLGFEFTAISFYEPQSLGFRYRLLGYHEDWRETDEASQRVVSYTNLPAGRYRFEVQGSTVEHAWGPAAFTEFSIAPSFRETPWFLVSVVAAIALLGVLIAAFVYRLQRQHYRQRSAELEALVQQRTADLAEANERLHEASQTDPLTGLRNRRYLSTQIPKDLAFYMREIGVDATQPRVILFALVDIDHFKRINDTLGHAVGDRVLQQFSEVLQAQVRTGDYVARWGGEEFVLVFRPMPLSFLPVLGERLRSAVASFDFDVGGSTPLQVTCSIGLCQYPLIEGDTNSLEWEHLLELADRALYRIKREGRNGWGAYQALPGTRVEQITALLREGEQSLEHCRELRFMRGGPNGPA